MAPHLMIPASELGQLCAPYLIERLCKLGIAEEPELAAQLFEEVKRYLWICAASRDRPVPMFSTRIDEVWHQFILFTREYRSFCVQLAGRYLDHEPSEGEPVDSVKALTRGEFAEIYAERFGPLSELWQDELSITPDTRLAHAPEVGPFAVRIEAERALLLRSDPSGTVLCRVDARAEQALRFICGNRRFIVRELPGLASSGEQVDLARPLVQFNILGLAP